MKATITILAAVLTLQAGILFARNDNNDKAVPVANESSTISIISLAPATPTEATFEDVITIIMIDLMPLTPSEATFDDMPTQIPSIIDLLPETPSVADFEDAVYMIVSTYFKTQQRSI